jgi:hypothetical protein
MPVTPAENPDRSTPTIAAHIDVAAPPDIAYATFVAHIGSWWPLRDKNVLGPTGSVAFEGDTLVERNLDATAVWAEIVGSDDPRSLRLDFHPGKEPEQATHLAVTFAATPRGTRVALEETEWDRFRVHSSVVAEEVTKGWNEVLKAFAGRFDPVSA